LYSTSEIACFPLHKVATVKAITKKKWRNNITDLHSVTYLKVPVFAINLEYQEP